MKKAAWTLWLFGVILLSGYYSYGLLASPDKSDFLIGEATHGHHQIELACTSCHTEPFGGGEVLQEACVNCHGTELKAANDSHPKSKFTDPRNADRLAHLDARACVTCHREHKLDQTGPMGVTQPNDFCFHCHQDIATDRPSHRGMDFDSCGSAGCHNYHDNRALYEAFLVKNAHQPITREIAALVERSAAAVKHPPTVLGPALTDTEIDAPATAAHPHIVNDWLGTAHANAGVNCGGCHQGTQSDSPQWVEKPSVAMCQTCHQEEAETFFQGKHGMRLSPALAIKLPAMTPAQGRLTFKPNSADRELTCNSCHAPHRFDLRQAAVESCVGCHDDDHSRAYMESAHYRLWLAEQDGQAPSGTGVTCAGCHLPREAEGTGDPARIVVNHNQNHNLRPNEKMIRSVCQTCHGLGFSIDALADAELVRNNFNGRPAKHIESVDMAKRREGEPKP